MMTGISPVGVTIGGAGRSLHMTVSSTGTPNNPGPESGSILTKKDIEEELPHASIAVQV